MKKILNHGTFNHDLNIVNLRLIFLVSALNASGRKIIIEQCNGRAIVIDFLKHIMQKYSHDDLG